MKNFLMRLVKKWGWKFFWLFKIQENKVIACSFKGNSYSDNPKYLVEELLRRKKSYRIYWELRDKEDAKDLPDGVFPIKYDSFQSLFHMATAKYWIDNARKNAYIQKREGQYYIQTWHGGFALKKVEKDAQEELPAYYIKSAIKDSQMADLFIADSEAGAEIFRKSFWYDGEILKCGLPRNDILMHGDKEKEKSIRKKYGIGENEKIILYAPTFRQDQSLDAYKIGFEECLESFQNNFGGIWRIGIKLHPGMRKHVSELQLPEGIFDFSSHLDIQELYLISEVLITDYSSAMFDFMFTKRMCILYAIDIEEYKKERGFYTELEKLPFPIVTNHIELEKCLQEYNVEQYRVGLDEFVHNYNFVTSGNASKDIVDWMDLQK